MYLRCRACTSLVLVVQSMSSLSHLFSTSVRQPIGFQSGLPAWYSAVDPQLVVSDATISSGATRQQLLVAKLLICAYCSAVAADTITDTHKETTT